MKSNLESSVPSLRLALGLLVGSTLLVGCGANTPKNCLWVTPTWSPACKSAPVTAAVERAPVAEYAAQAEPEPVAESTARVVVKSDKIEILEKVQFETSRAAIRAESSGLLDEVAQVLRNNPQIARVRIEGHTDSRGKASFNRKLSQLRADAVKRYLVDAGIAEQRLETAGYGADQPIASNADAAGRDANRRVEFTILQ